MASGPNWNPQRGTYWVQWFDGLKWRRPTVTKKKRGWKPSDGEPKKVPPEAMEAFVDYQKREEAARKAPRRDPEQRIATFLHAYAEHYKDDRADGSHVELLKAVGVFLEWCGGRDLTMVGQVTSEACREWVRHRSATKGKRSGQPMERATVKKERALLSGAWRSAEKVGQVESNPWKRTEVPGKSTRKQRGSWSPEEFKKLMAVSDTWLRDVLSIGCYSGLRIEALRGIEWRDIRLPKASETGLGFIVVRPELDKIHRGYEVPILDECHDVLCRRRIHRDDPRSTVLTGKLGRPLLRANQTDQAIRAACKRAGLKNPDSPNHHMRRTFGRWAVLGHLTGRPVPMYVVSQWMGHTSVEMTEKYLAMTVDDSAKWMERVHPPDANASAGQEPVST